MVTKFFSVNLTCTLWLIVTILRLGRAEDVLNNSKAAIDSLSSHGSPSVFTAGLPSQINKSAKLRPPRASTKLARRPCLAPRQPVNGEWRIRQELCEDTIADCKIPEGSELEPTYQLVYSCNPGYAIKGNADVICQAWGSWTSIPVCVEIKCPTLNSEARIASCSRSRERVSCDFPVLPRTRAELLCRPGYKTDTSYSFAPGNILYCNEDGKWEPAPSRCIPVCGKVATRQTPFITGGTPAKISDFPWHATLYFQEESARGTRKVFRCGATIIQANLLLTAGHCVYDETYETTTDPKKLFILTGNTRQDYDSPEHDYRIVRKAEVKSVHVSCSYYGIQGNYASDIALLELREPFVLSQILLPACLDFSGYSEQFLETRPFGKVAGFGRTDMEETSSSLRTVTVPYIPYSECRDSKNADANRAFITLDKFCAGYSNGSGVSNGDSGGGLVFQQNELWYILGIVSVGLGVNIEDGETTADRYSYSLYTKVTMYVDWIRNVIYNLETYKKHPPCRPDSTSSVTTTSPNTAPSGVGDPATVATSVCGRVTTRQTSSSTRSGDADVSSFPWHASLYVEWKTSKDFVKRDFVCGATIIHPKLLITTARCVEMAKSVTNLYRILVMTGNVISDYDSPDHDFRIVKKGVANSVRTCQYRGTTPELSGNLGMLELEDPFELSDVLRPACFDTTGYGDTFPELGAYGRIAGFGLTNTGKYSGILQTVTVPIVSNTQCKSVTCSEPTIPVDRSCVDHTNGSVICEGDDGGGLVIEKDGQWYVVGILSSEVSVYLDYGRRQGYRQCYKSSYVFYATVSMYTEWIRDAISMVEKRLPIPNCYL